MRTVDLVSDAAGERIDTLIARRLPELSRSHVRKLIDAGFVTIDGRVPKPSEKPPVGAQLRVEIPPPEEMTLEPEDIRLTIIYQDADIIVVDKPPGLTVHPAPGHPSGTLVNALLAIVPDLQGISGTLRPGIVHRLDKDTSGLIVVAKNDRAMRTLQAQLKERLVHKAYIAVVEGIPDPREGLIEAPLGRHPKNRKKQAVVAGGREASTKYKVRETLPGNRSLLEAEPVTGRTHQIRVHLAAIGHPIVGDALYGKRSNVVSRQFLHAARLGFVMPSGRRVDFESPLPPDLRAALEELRD